MKRFQLFILIPISVCVLGLSACGSHQTKGDNIPKADLSHQSQDRVISGQSIREWKQLKNQLVQAHQAVDHLKAEELAKQALILAEREFGHEYIHTLTSMNDLVFVYQAQGQSEKAIPLNEETLALRKKVLGKQHPHTLISMNNLAELYRDQGHYEKAEPLLVETLALSKDVLGKQHRDTLSSINNLASSHP